MPSSKDQNQPFASNKLEEKYQAGRLAVRSVDLPLTVNSERLYDTKYVKEEIKHLYNKEIRGSGLHKIRSIWL